jgi:hypothetical protein
MFKKTIPFGSNFGKSVTETMFLVVALVPARPGCGAATPP